jgi:hypothetical protein
MLTSLLALKAFLNSVVADDLHLVVVEGSTLTIVKSNALDVVLGTFELKDAPPPAADPEVAKTSAKK